MNQSFIDALMHFFSLLLLPLPGRKISNNRQKLEEYITKAGIEFPVEECIKIFNTYTGKYFFEFSNNPYGNKNNTRELDRRLIIEAGHKSQMNLLLQERVLVILSLLEFNFHYNDNDLASQKTIKNLSVSLNLSDNQYNELHTFLFQEQKQDTDFDLILDSNRVSDELEGEWIDENKPVEAGLKKMFIEKVTGRLHFKLFEEFNYIAFIYTGNESLLLNDKKIYPKFFYSFRKKDNLRFKGIDSYDFDEIESYFNPSERLPKIILSGKNISFRYGPTNYSIKAFDFHEESGQLIGIIGNNGVGKSTILKLISSQLRPDTGQLLINGSDLIENSYKLASVIGYVPHDEILINEFTVYENLLYQAKLCLGNLNPKEIEYRIQETIKKLHLQGIAHQIAGASVQNKLTDYQRICLKIAIEMIRKPYILYLDEPFSGLGFSDIKRLIALLKEEVNQGKLVILTSQLPSTEIFNMFDKIWMIDIDGYLVYNGDPRHSLTFLRNTGLLPYYFIQSRKDEISAEDIVKIIETKKIDADGRPSDERQVSPGAWYDAWRSECAKKRSEKQEDKKPIPIHTSGLPSIEKQFATYLLRNIRLRFKRITYLILLLLGPPILGSAMAWSIRLGNEPGYLLSDNEFLPLFFFLSVNLIFMIGILTSAEEIIRERKQLKRDISLNISLFSYQNSKVVYLLLISVCQAVLYTVSTNLILGIVSLNLKDITIYFSIAVTGNLVGLVLSSGLQKIKYIYLLIPFLILPSMFYSGYLIPYDKTKNFPGIETNKIPLISAVSPCRYAFEALMIIQYSENPYNKYFFKYEKTAYNSRYLQDIILPVLKEDLVKCNYFKYMEEYPDSLEYFLNEMKNEFQLVRLNEDIAPFEKINEMTTENYDSTLYEDIYGYLTYLGFLMENMTLEAEAKIRANNSFLQDSLFPDVVSQFKAENHNMAVERNIVGKNYEREVIKDKNRLFKEGSNVFLIPENGMVRSQFFASEKRFNNQLISTFRMNLSIIWLMNTFIYIMFLINIIQRIRKIIVRNSVN